jgi:hypothetical protein
LRDLFEEMMKRIRKETVSLLCFAEPKAQQSTSEGEREREREKKKNSVCCAAGEELNIGAKSFL